MILANCCIIYFPLLIFNGNLSKPSPVNFKNYRPVHILFYIITYTHCNAATKTPGCS